MQHARNQLVDFWRGFILVVIFINHIPGNLIEHATPRNFGFSDSAEAFVFLAGLSVSLVYYPRIPQGDVLTVVQRCFRRALELYRVHLVLTFAAIALSAVAYVVSDDIGLIEEHGRRTVFEDTAKGVTGILMLGHQLGYFNILPLYVLLMLWAPIALILARIHLAFAFGVAVLMYGLARSGDLTMPSWPEPGTWFFNPFAWQLLFTSGIVCGVLFGRQRPPLNSIVLWMSLCVLALGFVMQTNALGLIDGLRDWAMASYDLSKSDLGLLRLAHFLALAYVIACFGLGAQAMKTAVGEELSRLGRNGLAVFAAGSILSALGQTVMTLAAVRETSYSPSSVGMVFTLAGIAAMAALGRYLEWNTPVRTQAGAKRRAAPIGT